MKENIKENTFQTIKLMPINVPSIAQEYNHSYISIMVASFSLFNLFEQCSVKREVNAFAKKYRPMSACAVRAG